MIELNKQTMCVGEQSVAVFSQAYCESDIIVPDVKPDIAKILQADANIVISNKFCNNDKITVEGKANINVLYLGDDGNVGGINTAQQFSHLIEAKGAADGMAIDINADVENIDCNAINSRKLSIKVLIGMDANAVMPVNLALCTGIMDDMPFEKLCKTIKPYSTVVNNSEQFSIKERLELPSGKPSISNILKLDAKIMNKETKIVNDKIIVKGNLCVATLYIGDMEENNVQFMEHEIPFTEVVEANGADENMAAQVKFNIDQVNYDVDEDSDGDNRILNVGSIISANVKVSNESEVEVIEDAYSIEEPVLIAKETATINRLAADNKSQVTIKDVASLSNDLPEIMQVYNVVATPYVGTTRIENGKVVVEGVIDTNILYLSNDEASPVNSYKHEQKFSQYMDVEGVDESMLCDINIDVEHINYNISMGREVELRFVLGIGVKVIANENISNIVSIEKAEQLEPETKRGCCIRIYFVKKEDTLWDIAKKYRTTQNNIMNANEMTAENELYIGRQLIIP